MQIWKKNNPAIFSAYESIGQTRQTYEEQRESVKTTPLIPPFKATTWIAAYEEHRHSIFTFSNFL